VNLIPLALILRGQHRRAQVGKRPPAPMATPRPAYRLKEPAWLKRKPTADRLPRLRYEIVSN